MPINSGYSFYEYAGDGVTTRFPIQFSLGELKRAYVTCRVDNEVDAFGAPLYRALADVPGDPGMIEVLGAVPGVGAPIVFRRIVPKELLLHLYANGSILDYPSLDESHLQLMMALHEVLDGYGLTNVFTDINMNGYKLTNVYSDPDDPDSIATVAFLGTYRQDALDAAIAAADGALEALGYRNATQVLANAAAASAQNSAASALLASGSATAADGFADDAEQSALDAIAAVNSAAFTNIPIGTLVWHTGTTAFPGSVVADGEIRSRAAFPDLWAFAQTSGNISVDDASWTFGQYSPGDGSTTFRVPKVDDRFIRGKSSTRAVGLVEEDEFKIHTHLLYAKGYTYGTLQSGAGQGLDGAVASYTIASGGYNANTGGDETRPKALTMLPCIKAYDVISDPNVLNAVGVVNDIARMMPRDENINLGVSVPASGTAVDFVGIPEGVKRITVMFDGVSTNGTSNPIVRVGAANVLASGYSSKVSYIGAINSSGTVSHTTGFPLSGINGSHFRSVAMTLTRMGSSWVCMVVGGFDEDTLTMVGGGKVALSNDIKTIRITTANGTDQFDAGTINISWEF